MEKSGGPGFVVLEFFGNGDPFFGGSADDRPLGKSGSFLSGSYPRAAVAEFESESAAIAAANAAPNKRDGGLISSFRRA